MEEHRDNSSSNSDSNASDSSEPTSSESNSSNSSDSNQQEQAKNISVPQNTTQNNDSKHEPDTNNSDSNSEPSDSNSSNSSNTSHTNSDPETNLNHDSNGKNSQLNSSANAKTENDQNKAVNNQTPNVEKAKPSSDSNSESSHSNSDSESTSSKPNQSNSEVNNAKSAENDYNQHQKSKSDKNENNHENAPKSEPNNQNQIEKATPNENQKTLFLNTKSSTSSELSDSDFENPLTKSILEKSDNDNSLANQKIQSCNSPSKDKEGSSNHELSESDEFDIQLEKFIPPQISSDQTFSESKKLFDFTVVQDGLDPNRKTDRFGWAIEENSEPPPPRTKKSKKKLQKEVKQEQLREAKWVFMMKPENWPKFYDLKGKYRKVLERRVMKGIPDGVRSAAWRLILDPESISNPSRPTVEYYSDLGIPQCDHVIRVDIPRTMPRVPIFARKDIRTSLYVILRAYSNLDRELDYFQGMGFIAAILVSYMDETSAFWSFEKIMKGEFHMQRNFYFPEFKGLHEMNRVWDIFLKNKFPTVYRNLTANQLSPMLYTPIWFLTCFMAVEFQPRLKLRIFDRFTLFGTRAILSFGATIVDLHKEELSTNKDDKIIQILNHPQNNAKLNDIDNVLKFYDKNFISKRDYDKYCKKAGLDPIP